jgi:hypothetical protein
MILVLVAQRLISKKIECRDSQIKIILLETGKSNSTNEQQRISEKNTKSMNKNGCPVALILPFTK